MANSNLCWRRESFFAISAAMVMMIFIGSADATTCNSASPCKARANAVAKCNAKGVCEYSCKQGWTNCDGDWSNGCEKNTVSDTRNCGSCGRWCIPYHEETVITQCINSKCVYTCKAGLSDCNNWLNDGCESRLPYNNDLRFCGACDTPCLLQLPNADSKCNRGKCEYSCHPGWANCDNNWKNGCERPVTGDPSNCGACGKKCSNPMPQGTFNSQCVSGMCKYACKEGRANCDQTMKNGCEIDTTKNIYHCGRCHKSCKVTVTGAEATCSNGHCGQRCKNGKKFNSYKNACL